MHRTYRAFNALVIVCLFFAVLVFTSSSQAKGNSFNPAGLEQTQQFQPGWTMEFDFTLDGPEGQVESGQARVDSLSSRIQANDIAVETVSSPLVGGGGQLYQMKLSSAGDAEQFRQTVFGAMKPDFNLLADETELTISAFAAKGQPIDVILEANPSTGYIWRYAEGSNVKVSTSDTFEVYSSGTGHPERQTVHLAASASGLATARLVYARPWENNAVSRRISIQLNEMPAQLNLSDPSPVIREFPAQNEPAAEIPIVATLPTALDWRSQGIVPAVRDQGVCGGCYAFGTVGIMESAMKKNGYPLTDLSEQFLISCNTDGWSCAGGGLTAQKYHYDTLGAYQSSVGAVLESAKPYTATNGSCSVAYAHPYKSSGWQLLNSNQWAVQSVDEIKSTIQTYGPVTTGVCVNSPNWSYYSGGIYRTNDDCGAASINHQIILVGWNDNGGDGYWIVRNSWGPGWGESGYMRMAYGISHMGQGTSWVKMPSLALPAAPVLSGPTGTVYTTKPAFKWAPSAGATTYQIYIRDTSVTTYAVNTSVDLSKCTSTSCTYVPTTALQIGKSYYWKVVAKNAKGSSPASAVKTITISPKPDTPVISAPSGNITSTKPTYTWSRISNATSYVLQVYDIAAAAYVANVSLGTSVCSTTTNKCNYVVPKTLILNKEYQWRIQAKNSYGAGPVSAFKKFKIINGFLSTFDGSHADWSIHPGGTWANSSTSFYTSGAANKVSSASFAASFQNFTYQVRMKRVSTTGFSSGLILRGTPTFNASNNWLNSYLFVYSQDGYFSVWKEVNGVEMPLKAWSTSAAILKNNWNLLKVTMNGSAMSFYMNGTLVWSGSDTQFKSGRVGVQMFRSDVVETLYIDYAKLSLITTTAASPSLLDEQIEKGQVELPAGQGSSASPYESQ